MRKRLELLDGVVVLLPRTLLLYRYRRSHNAVPGLSCSCGLLKEKVRRTSSTETQAHLLSDELGHQISNECITPRISSGLLFPVRLAVPCRLLMTTVP